jgi:putative membrane protein
MMWYWGGGMQWWGWLLGALGMAVFWGLVIWAVWYLVGAVLRRPDVDRRTPDPKRILDERLAKGEIDADEYRRIRDLMTGEPDRAANGREPAGTGERR